MDDEASREETRGRPPKGPDQVRRLRINLSVSREEARIIGEGMRILGGSSSPTAWIRQRVVAATLRELVEKKRAERGRTFG